MNIEAILMKLHSIGFCLDVIYDVGAHDGGWSRNLRAHLPNSRFILFEANENHLHGHIGFESYHCILSDSVKPVDFYSNGSTGDSYYIENSKYYVDCHPRAMVATTLDQICLHLPAPNFLKLDTQGSELDILRGAQKTIANTSLILTEMPICQYNRSSPTFDDYIKYFSKMRYLPLGVVEVHHGESILIQVDILFAREDDFYRCIGKPKQFDLEKLCFHP